MSEAIEDILTKAGLDLRNESSNYWRALPIYRKGSNPTALRISKENGGFIDFAAGKKGNLYELIQLCIGLGDIKDAKKWVNENGGVSGEETIRLKPKIFVDKKVNVKYSEDLMPNFSFYENKGISRETLDRFECGVCFSGKQNNRFVFIIRNEDGELKGVAGRDLLGDRVKWKLLGDKRKWIFPQDSIEWVDEEIWLVESIGDMLALRDIGVKSVFVLFGVVISPILLNFLASFSNTKIYISTNNDSQKEENWGLMAAKAIYEKLSKVIDKQNLIIALPPDGDWGDLSKENRKEHVEKIRSNQR